MGIINFTRNVNLILRTETQSKKALFFTYLKLIIKYLLFIKILKLNISKEKIFGFKVEFFDYPTFIFLFEEIFINKEYYFNTKTENPFIIDCGANVGIALIFFKMLYPNSKIISFEPDDKTFELLKKNVEMNNLKNVKLFNKAVFNLEGDINFYYEPNHPGLLIMSTIKDRLPKSHKKVHSILLSNFVEQPVDFLKMDIEGAEYVVIEELLQHNKLKLIKEMCIEYHHHIKPNDDSFSKILKIFEENDFGYQICSFLRPPFTKEIFQDVLLYVYTK